MDFNLHNNDEFEYIATNVEGTEVSEDIIITKNAINMLAQQLKDFIIDLSDGKNYFVRLFLLSSPSKAKKYSLKFESVINDFDRIFNIGQLQIVVNRKDLFYFMGVIIDYVFNEKEEGYVFLDTSDYKVIDYYNLKNK